MHYFSQAFNYKWAIQSFACTLQFMTFLPASHPWSHVVIGMWHKYPNPHCSHVMSVDVLDRTVDPDTGIVRTERILGCKQKTPTWILKVSKKTSNLRSCAVLWRTQQLFGGSEDAFVREVSFVDPRTQTCSITSVNLSLSQFATCYERIQYMPSPSQPKAQTNFTQTAEIQARLDIWRSMSDRLEKFLAERFEQNAQKGKLGFTDVLRTLWEERWEGKEQQRMMHS